MLSHPSDFSSTTFPPFVVFTVACYSLPHSPFSLMPAQFFTSYLSFPFVSLLLSSAISVPVCLSSLPSLFLSGSLTLLPLFSLHFFFLFPPCSFLSSLPLSLSVSFFHSLGLSATTHSPCPHPTIPHTHTHLHTHRDTCTHFPHSYSTCVSLLGVV